MTARELAPCLYSMWVLFFLLAVCMLARAKHLDPLPFLPLMVAVQTVHLGFRLAAIWFVMTFENTNPVTFPEYWFRTMDPVLLRPLIYIFCGLTAHALIYAFSELRTSRKRKKLTPSTRIAFHIILLMIGITVWVHFRIFDETILLQRRNFIRLPRAVEVDGYGLESPAGEPPDFKVQLYPDSLF